MGSHRQGTNYCFLVYIQGREVLADRHPVKDNAARPQLSLKTEAQRVPLLLSAQSEKPTAPQPPLTLSNRTIPAAGQTLALPGVHMPYHRTKCLPPWPLAGLLRSRSRLVSTKRTSWFQRLALPDLQLTLLRCKEAQAYRILWRTSLP